MSADSALLTVAVPKGRILSPLLELLDDAGIDTSALRAASRRLVVADEAQGLRFILTKPADVPTYVEYGAADVGFVGKDMLLEGRRAVAELLDMGIARCRLIVAVPMQSPVQSARDLTANSRVATRYPQATAAFFHNVGLQVDIVPLHGSIELAPLVGLADAVVDITETGSTLRANGLRIVDTIADISTRLIANPIRHKVLYDRVEDLVERLRARVEARTEAAARVNGAAQDGAEGPSGAGAGSTVPTAAGREG